MGPSLSSTPISILWHRIRWIPVEENLEKRKSSLCSIFAWKAMWGRILAFDNLVKEKKMTVKSVFSVQQRTDPLAIFFCLQMLENLGNKWDLALTLHKVSSVVDGLVANELWH